MTDKTINLSFRVTDKRQEQLKIAAARRRMSIQEMLEKGLDLLLSNKNNALGTKVLGDLSAISRHNARKEQAIKRVIVACENLVGLSEPDTDSTSKTDHAREVVKLLTRTKATETSRPATRKRPRKGDAH